MSDTALNKYIQYGTAAERAAFTPDPPQVGGSDVQTLYIWYETDNAPDTYVWNGAAWVQINSAAPAAGQIYKVTFVIDGGGSPISTGATAPASIPVTGTIVRARLLADQAGDAEVDIWNDTFANYPPTVADTITGGNEPALTADISFEDTTLTSWTTAVTAGDVMIANLNSVDGVIERLTIELFIQP